LHKINSFFFLSSNKSFVHHCNQEKSAKAVADASSASPAPAAAVPTSAAAPKESKPEYFSSIFSLELIVIVIFSLQAVSRT
jgi:hypothetical protein